MVKIYIKTFGCSYNQSDSEVMAGLLKTANFEIVNNSDPATLVIINSCAVKTPTEKKVLKYIQEIKSKGKEVIVAGCISQATPEILEDVSMIGPTQINHIVEVVEETINENNIAMLVPEKGQRLNLPRIRKNKSIEIIPICAGCLGNCSYCITKKARGDLISFEIDDILAHAKTALKNYASQIWLTAQDTGCYGKDINTNLIELLEKLFSIKGNFFIRLGMANPNFVLEILPELIRVYQNSKMYKFLHIPVQSGNNEILKLMNRNYTVEEFKEIITKFREKIPNITIATDVICGFPTETTEQFNDTIKLIKEVKPDIVNISRYWERPHTKSATLDGKLHEKETKERSRRLSELFEWISYENLKKWEQWVGSILIESHGKDNTSVGRNFAYKQIILKGKYPIGSFVQVKAVKATTFYLQGIEQGFYS
jgi:threonylcarbamoyladenosine tRNA methylthiotransferase CDKAL1